VEGALEKRDFSLWFGYATAMSSLSNWVPTVTFATEQKYRFNSRFVSE
jgi:hypothetical protein